jgi:HD-GYP domain-containing protein (c-di-GMP phosphodiesterase class II)
MGTQQKHSLKTFVHRTLVIRIIVTALLIAFVLGLTVFLRERNRISERVISIALQRTKLFNAQYSHLFDTPGLPDHETIQREMENFRSGREKLDIGTGIFVRLYNSDLNIIAEDMDKNYAGIEAVKELIDTSERWIPRHGADEWHEIVRVEGYPYLRIIVPLVNTAGAVVGIGEGVFAPSPETIQGIRRKAVMTMLIVIAIVLVTTALLYPVILNLMNKLSTFSVKLLDSNLETLETLGSAIALRDSDTNAHNYRVTIISVRIAEAAGLSLGEIRTLIKGAFLHDVGKIGIRDKILLKPARLTSEEFTVMKTHVSHGQEIVNRSTWLNDALEVVGYHHEKVNGQGYLKGLDRKDIPVTARIFAIADVFDALTSKRPYKEPLSFDDTMNILKEGKGSHFDPDLLDTFEGIAKPLYDRLSGREEIPREELQEIIRKYFTEGMDSLEY